MTNIRFIKIISCTDCVYVGRSFDATTKKHELFCINDTNKVESDQYTYIKLNDVLVKYPLIYTSFNTNVINIKIPKWCGLPKRVV